MDFLQYIDVTQIIMFLIPVVAGAFAVWYRKRLAEWRAFWGTVLDGLRSIPELKTDVRGIRAYVAPNGGGSLSDAVTRTESAVGKLTENVGLIINTLRAENDLDDDVGRFYADATGAITYANQVYARWLKVGKAELQGWNYLSFILPTDVERVREQWTICREEHRQYRARYQMVPTDGTTFSVEVVATPIPDTSPVNRWVGVVRKVNHE